MVHLSRARDGSWEFFAPAGIAAASTTKRLCQSTEGFLAVTPHKTKHQLFLCQESRQLILFLPSIEHQCTTISMDQNKILQHLLLQSFRGDVKIKKHYLLCWELLFKLLLHFCLPCFVFLKNLAHLLIGLCKLVLVSTRHRNSWGTWASPVGLGNSSRIRVLKYGF